MTPAEAENYDRKQRAREAYYDSVSLPESHEPAAFDEAIETAIRVRVDKALCAAAWAEHEKRTAPLEGADDPEFINVLIAAFEAAGFEVEA